MTIEVNNTYENFSLSGAKQYHEEIQKSKEMLSQYDEIKQYVPYVSILPLQSHLSHHGEASGYGIIGIAERVMHTMQQQEQVREKMAGVQIPQKVIDFLLVHESLHTIFSLTFQTLYKKHRDVLDLFHTTIVPHVCDTGDMLTHNETYIQEKSHISLAGGYKIDVTLFLQKYFDALKKDMVQEMLPWSHGYVLPYSRADMLKKYQEAKQIPVDVLYNQDKQSFSKKVLTGMYAGVRLENSIKSYDDLYQEEGMVNYMAGLLTQIDVMEVNQYFRQDMQKIAFVKQLQQKGLSLQECFTKITSWQDIPKMY